MAKYVPDVKTQRWVVIAPSRTKRPTFAEASSSAEASVDRSAGKPDDATPVKTHVCPFCPGNESVTPPEVFRIGEGVKDGPGWLVRVVPNLYPITDIHEVIIHSTDDQKDLEDLPLDQVVRVMETYRQRYRTHQDTGQVMIFCNHGLHAGASLNHPHSQLVVVPRQINLDTLSREPLANVVEENTYYRTYCPDFSQWPYEVWIAPKGVGTKFGDLTDEEVPDLAEVLQKALRRVRAVYDDPASVIHHAEMPFGYNFYMYHGVNWYIRIIPRFIHRAGFELGTGLNVNVVDPVSASEILKHVAL
ncbi:MAG: hypothetical protein Q8L37_05005 [Candidatus Gottesmanbacteria bacterium]|nr:hypothetical protein [Candidatus Gottesmanbacteria bacterium]